MNLAKFGAMNTSKKSSNDMKLLYYVIKTA